MVSTDWNTIWLMTEFTKPQHSSCIWFTKYSYHKHGDLRWWPYCNSQCNVLLLSENETKGKENIMKIAKGNKKASTLTNLFFMANIMALACSAAFPTIGSRITLIKATGKFNESDAPCYNMSKKHGSRNRKLHKCEIEMSLCPFLRLLLLTRGVSNGLRERTKQSTEEFNYQQDLQYLNGIYKVPWEYWNPNSQYKKPADGLPLCYLLFILLIFNGFFFLMWQVGIWMLRYTRQNVMKYTACSSSYLICSLTRR